MFLSVSETVNASEACVQSSTESRQHVTFPNHFLVPEALKTCLTFGSFDNFGPRERSSSGTGGDNNTSAALESSPGSDETATSRFVSICCLCAYQIIKLLFFSSRFLLFCFNH